MDILFTLEALDGSGAAETLRFSQLGFVDDSGLPYDDRIVGPAQLSISPNDGGLLSIFKTASVGDIALSNTDGGLDYLADYAVDGRAASISVVDGETVTTRFTGTAVRGPDQGDTVVFALRAAQETLSADHPLAVYLGDNTPPTGLEGEDDTIKGTVKPKLLGDVRNVAGVLVNAPLQIYQVSSLSNCRITAVYDDGVRLANFYVNGAHAVGTVGVHQDIAVRLGLGDIPAGSEIVFSNHSTIYTVFAGITAGVLTLASGLTAAVSSSTTIEVVNFYADTSALQYNNYLVNGDHVAGVNTIAVDSGVGAITAGDLVTFGSQSRVYTVSTGLTDGVIVLDMGIADDLSAGDEVQVIGILSPAHWGSFQGYFRLSSPPAGVVTCDAVSLDGSGLVHKAGDVFSALAAEVGFTVDSAGVTEFNGAGTVGLFIGAATPTLELFNRLAASVAGYYYFVGTELFLQLLQAPDSVATLTIEDEQIKAISRSALGLGSNGVPIYSVVCKYDRIETAQATVAGDVSNARRQRLKLQYREADDTDDAILTRHPLSLPLTIESLLRSGATALLSRVAGIVNVRRDVVDLTLDSGDIGVPVIGATINVVTHRLGYSAGRLLVIVGYDRDEVNHEVTLRLFG